MMDQPTGRFEPLPNDLTKELKSVWGDLTGRAQEAGKILAKAPKPTLYVGEIVDIKGIKFTVTRIKANGKLGLRMVAG